MCRRTRSERRYREASMQKIPYMLVVGEQEAQAREGGRPIPRRPATRGQDRDRRVRRAARRRGGDSMHSRRRPPRANNDRTGSGIEQTCSHWANSIIYRFCYWGSTAKRSPVGRNTSGRDSGQQVVLVMFQGRRRAAQFFHRARCHRHGPANEDLRFAHPGGGCVAEALPVIKEGDTLRLETSAAPTAPSTTASAVQGTIPLEPGDPISRIGPVVFVVQIDGVPPDETMDPFTVRAAHQLEDSLTDDGR